jgi:dienelactone hydrolase
MDDPVVSRRQFVQRTVSVAGGVLTTTSGLTELGHGDQPGTEAAKTLEDVIFQQDQHELFRQQLGRALGGPWPKPCPLEPELGETIVQDGYRIERVSFLSEPDDQVPALLLVPEGVTGAQPAAAVCVWHQHNGQYHLGKSEPAGLAGNPEHHTGAALARLGYVVLCIDALGFEERQNRVKPVDANGKPDGAGLKDGAYERFLFLRYVVRGKSLAWKNILDMRRAVDYLVTRREVDPERIGCYGHSMGSTHTWLVGPWEPRLKALVGNCCLPTYRGIECKQLLHCFPNFIPGIYPHHDTPDIAALIAPRPLHLNFGELDRGSPIDEARRAVKLIARTYQDLNATENFSHFIEPGVGHVLSEPMWEKVQTFFARHLG